MAIQCMKPEIEQRLTVIQKVFESDPVTGSTDVMRCSDGMEECVWRCVFPQIQWLFLNHFWLQNSGSVISGYRNELCDGEGD